MRTWDERRRAAHRQVAVTTVASGVDPVEASSELVRGTERGRASRTVRGCGPGRAIPCVPVSQGVESRSVVRRLNEDSGIVKRDGRKNFENSAFAACGGARSIALRRKRRPGLTDNRQTLRN